MSTSTTGAIMAVTVVWRVTAVTVVWRAMVVTVVWRVMAVMTTIMLNTSQCTNLLTKQATVNKRSALSIQSTALSMATTARRHRQ